MLSHKMTWLKNRTIMLSVKFVIFWYFFIFDILNWYFFRSLSLFILLLVHKPACLKRKDEHEYINSRAVSKQCSSTINYLIKRWNKKKTKSFLPVRKQKTNNFLKPVYLIFFFVLFVFNIALKTFIEIINNNNNRLHIV